MKLYVPLMQTVLNAENNEKYVKWLKEMGCDTVFISPASRKYVFTELKSELNEYMKKVGENVAFFKNAGFNVGIWIESFGFGGRLSDYISERMDGEPRITSVLGNVAGDGYCPEGEKYTELCKRHVKAIAKYAKPDMIMFDDEMCLSVRPGLGCFCEKHLKLYEQKFGKPHTRDELKALIFTGYNEKYRKGWLEVVGDSMRKFCRDMRSALNEVNENIRMGFCAGYTSWDIEGADAIELTKLLAGDTKPFLRFTGAPYWSARDGRRFGAQKLSEIIECTRIQQQWCETENVEVFSECDTFPRPRYYVPFNLAEAFDIALRASGVDGVLKYLFCYDCPPDYEEGYAKRHLRNQPLYDFIDRNFNGKTTVGVKVFDEQRKIKDKIFPDYFIGEGEIEKNLFSPAAAMLTINSIPTTYNENYECGIVFGDVVKYVDKFPKKMIIDGQAALLLQERGYDLGITASSHEGWPVSEKFGENPPLLYMWGNTQYFRFTLKDGITPDSVFLDVNDQECPASYRCECNGTEFLVLCIDGYECNGCTHAVQSYYRQKQIFEFIGQPYPYIANQPGIYTLCKDGDGERAVLFLNICEDDLFDFEISLDKPYQSMEIFGADGELCKDKIRITSVVPAYGAIAIVLR